MAPDPTTPRHLPLRTMVAGVVLAIAGTGCSPAADAAGKGPATSGPGPVMVSGRGWTADGLAGEIPAPGSCRIRWTADHQPLPDPTCTPGAVDVDVTASTLRTTICRPGGYTNSVRPPVSLTGPAKRKVMIAYGLDPNTADGYEFDHLIPLSLGGASSIENLWPEPNLLERTTKSPYVNNDKDQVEADAHAAVCGGTASLVALQKQFAQDWSTIRVPPAKR